jgi:hypothetical protein
MDRIKAQPSTFPPSGMEKAMQALSNGEMWTAPAPIQLARPRNAGLDGSLINHAAARAFRGKCERTVDDAKVLMYESNQPPRSYNRFF